ncbi:MAG: nuclear transport factor 2 family protein [Acidipropionibacterium sp.]|nr:nuclear transport factor 2 family protein [Acidipropionibacterium sp.]
MTTPETKHGFETGPTSVSEDQVADRLSIRTLIDAYAHYADSREPELQYGLYTPDGRTLVYRESGESEPVQVLTTHDQHVEGFAALSQYIATTHFNGQSVITSLTSSTATVESYCFAHHVLANDDGRTLIVMSIRYEDSLVKTTRGWRFAERKLVIVWTDNRPLRP